MQLHSMPPTSKVYPAVSAWKLLAPDIKSIEGIRTISTVLQKVLLRPRSQSSTSTKPQNQTKTSGSTTSTASSNNQSTSTSNGFVYVDLGLSVKWATCNEGANAPSDYGTHYKWNEISDALRLPTFEELRELKSKCDWEWTNKNGHNGYIVTGPNGNSIFLPAAGYREADVNYEGSKGYYWSSTLDNETGSISTIMFDSNYVNHSKNYPSSRLSVRIVRP